MTALSENEKKLALASGIYVLVAMIVAAVFTLKGVELIAANKQMSAPTYETIQTPVSELPVVTDEKHPDDAGEDQSGVHDLDPAGLIEPALEVIRRGAVRRVIF